VWLPHCAPQCAEFYGREFALFGGVSGQASQLTSLSHLLEGVDAGKRRRVLQHMTKALTPVMEKGILHPPMTHR
jgi:pumilio family protein 6